MFANLRIEAAERLIEINFDGYAIGGLSVGEPTDIMINMVQITAPVLPEDKIRYLMGVGTPRDLVNSVAEGAESF